VEQVSKDMGTEMKATRLAKAVEGTAQARNILYSQAERLAAAGDEMGARAYAMAAQQHNVGEATRLLNRLESDYGATWAGHAEAAELAATVEREVSAWRTEAAPVTVQASSSAIAAARRTGDHAAAGNLAAGTVHDSIAAKLGAYAASQRDGVPYQDPIGPDTTPTIESRPVFNGNPSTTIR
jgi:3-methyladenine DNA glycosylase/8-oxoguanine DNA glycosylase